MPTLEGTVRGYAAVAAFNADAAAAAFFVQRGFSSFVRNGAGDYSLTMDQQYELDAECVVLATPLAATAGMIGVEVVSTTVMRVRSLDSAAMAADRDFWVAVMQIAP